MEGTFWDPGTKLYEHALDIRSAIHEIIAANIANEETPGYRALSLPFHEALQAAMHGDGPLLPYMTNPRHLPVLSRQDQPFLHVTTARSGGGPDGNTVNLEQEMTRMAENSLLYMAVAQFLAGRFDGWRSAIREGR
ncbi:MAG: flagellar basal body rod protein FlgB [Nitrospirae bacterium]|nr:MAG: flagellar basal body rod protein FlgB [Nitrospirota bacterium]